MIKPVLPPYMSGLKTSYIRLPEKSMASNPFSKKRTALGYLVERAAELGIAAQARAPQAPQPQHRRIVAGEICPETGFYFTPARTESRRLFQKGEVMPAFDTAYGMTIWQWNSNQT
jgi:hypothetical protein